MFCIARDWRFSRRFVRGYARPDRAGYTGFPEMTYFSRNAVLFSICMIGVVLGSPIVRDLNADRADWADNTDENNVNFDPLYPYDSPDPRSNSF